MRAAYPEKHTKKGSPQFCGGPQRVEKVRQRGLFRQNTFSLLANIGVLRAGRAQPLYLLTPAGRFAQQPTGLTLPFGACGAAGETCRETLLRKASESTALFKGYPNGFQCFCSGSSG